MYREIEATTCGSGIAVDRDLRPARMNYPRLKSEVSKTVGAMPLLEALELTVDNCMLREHNDCLRLIQPKDESGKPIQMSEATMTQIERSMRLISDVLCVKSENSEPECPQRTSKRSIECIKNVGMNTKNEHMM